MKQRSGFDGLPPSGTNASLGTGSLPPHVGSNADGMDKKKPTAQMQQMPQQQQQQQPKKRTVLPPEQQFGLLGLLSVIRMEDADRGTLALGTDLTSLGLNLNSSEALHTSFSSPWSDRPGTKNEPQFNLPQCFSVVNATPKNASKQTLKASHFSKFQLETLFYIFYAMPRDIAQVFAAQELYNREWRYHMEHKVWFSLAKEQQPPPQGQQQQYIYFDIQAWERRLFTNAALSNTLQSGFMQSSALFSIGGFPNAGASGAPPLSGFSNTAVS